MSAWEVSLSEMPIEEGEEYFETQRVTTGPDDRKVTVKVRTTEAGRDVTLSTMHLWRDGVCLWSAPLPERERFAYRPPQDSRITAIVGRIVSTYTVTIPAYMFGVRS